RTVYASGTRSVLESRHRNFDAGQPVGGRIACAMGVLGSYELDMSRTCWDATVTKKDAVMAGCAGRRTELLRFNGAVERDPAIDAWMKEHAGELGAIAHQWFEVMRKCGDEVRELLHDGCPVACLGDAPFGYVNVFSSHVNVGFFHGAALPDPARLL